MNDEVNKLIEQLRILSKMYQELKSKSHEMFRDFKLNDIEQWTALGKEVEHTKRGIIDVLSRVLKYIERECGKMSEKEKIIALCNFIRNFLGDVTLYELENAIAITFNSNRDYIRRIFEKYRRREILDLTESKRRKIYEKYNYSCIICGSKDRLVIHHIIPRERIICPNKVNEEDNLVVLCEDCHDAIHYYFPNLLPYRTRKEFYEIVNLWKNLLSELSQIAVSDYQILELLRKEFRQRWVSMQSHISPIPILPRKDYEFTDKIIEILRDENLAIKVKNLFEKFWREYLKKLNVMSVDEEIT